MQIPSLAFMNKAAHESIFITHKTKFLHKIGVWYMVVYTHRSGTPRRRKKGIKKFEARKEHKLF